MFDRLLIANRGEIAVRVARTCRELGVATVAVHSDVDADARHVKAADQAVHLAGVRAVDTYLNLDAIVEAARRTGAEAIHPGYGFLSERADAAQAVLDAGLVWIGPPPEATLAVGDKVSARRLATAAGVPVVPGTLDPVETVEEALAFGDEHGYPIAVKASGGGGGRGFRVADGPDDVAGAMESATREAVAYFGSPDVYLERYLRRPKHIEIQVLAPQAGRAMWLGARDCSMQRRHQKLIEETPPPRHRDVVQAMGEAAVRVANACGYVNAGTVEFLVDEDGSFHFLEVNARLQVEHTITEAVTGLDLVACQLRIAAGEPLEFGQADLEPGGRFTPRGHAIECRINAEDPARGFLPNPGTLQRYEPPDGPGVRVDGGFGAGDRIPETYDSLIAKLVVWAPDRDSAIRRMARALREFDVQGVRTTIPAHRSLIEHEAFADGSYSTRTVEEGALDALATGAPAGAGADAIVEATAPGSPEAVLMVDGTPVRLWNPAMASSVTAATGAAAPGGAVVAPMHGTILKVLVSPGDAVAAGDAVAVLEAMKMETHLATSATGTVTDVRVTQGDVVEAGQVVAIVG